MILFLLARRTQHGEAKFWLEPHIKLAKNYRLSETQLSESEEIIIEHQDEFRADWNRYLKVEVTNVTSNGIWLLTGERELFLSYDDFPWFKEVPIGKILNVEEPSPGAFLPARYRCGSGNRIDLNIRNDFRSN